MEKKNFITLIKFILLSQLAGIIGGLATASSVKTWYPLLTKPSFTPPSWLFSPVWITLYTLMGIAAYLVYKQGWEKREVRRAIILFIIHLGFNALWSVAFFGLQSPLLGMAVIVVLWVLILLTALQFSKVSKPAALLMLPYFLWVSFAGVLNYYLWQLN